jgi:hypothetical protein
MFQTQHRHDTLCRSIKHFLTCIIEHRNQTNFLQTSPPESSSRKPPTFYRTQSSITCIQEPANGLYPEVFFFLIPLLAHSGPRPLIQFRNHFSQTVGFLGRVICPSQGRCLHTGQKRDRIIAHTDTHALIGFEPMISVSQP